MSERRTRAGGRKEVEEWGAGGAQFFEMEGFDGASGAAFLKGLGASRWWPSGVIGDVPTLRRSERALLCKSVLDVR